jgi:hypothetical protein
MNLIHHQINFTTGREQPMHREDLGKYEWIFFFFAETIALCLYQTDK